MFSSCLAKSTGKIRFAIWSKSYVIMKKWMRFVLFCKVVQLLGTKRRTIPPPDFIGAFTKLTSVRAKKIFMVYFIIFYFQITYMIFIRLFNSCLVLSLKIFIPQKHNNLFISCDHKQKLTKQRFCFLNNSKDLLLLFDYCIWRSCVYRQRSPKFVVSCH